MTTHQEIDALAALITVVAEERAGMWTVLIGGSVTRSSVFGVSAGAAKIAAARALHGLGWRAVKP